MYNQDEEIAKKKKLYYKIATVLLATLTIVLIGWVTYVIAWNLLDGKKEEVKPKPVEQVIYDTSLIPSYENLSITMGRLSLELYGETLAEQLQKGQLRVPNSNITIPSEYLGSDVDIAVITIAAMQRNPYIVSSKHHPALFNATIDGIGDSVKTLPDGREIDLANIEERYSEIEFYGTRTDPSKVIVRGLSNGQYFEEEVDLNKYHQFYFNR